MPIDACFFKSSFPFHWLVGLYPLIRDYATIQSGFAFKSGDFENSGIRLVRNINISHGYINWEQVAYISKEELNSLSRFNLSEGDILISLDRPIISTGIKVARVSKEDIPCLLVQRVGRVSFKNNDVLPEYFFQWIRSPYFEAAINPGRSNGIPHISPKDIELLAFTPPPLYQQWRIVENLENMQAKFDTLKQLQGTATAEIDALLPSILDKAFKGEL
jgi:type I restriction enzyme, S subunit